MNLLWWQSARSDLSSLLFLQSWALSRLKLCIIRTSPPDLDRNLQLPKFLCSLSCLKYKKEFSCPIEKTLRKNWNKKSGRFIKYHAIVLRFAQFAKTFLPHMHAPNTSSIFSVFLPRIFFRFLQSLLQLLRICTCSNVVRTMLVPCTYSSLLIH